MKEPDASFADVLDWDIPIASESNTQPESNTDTELVNNPSQLLTLTANLQHQLRLKMCHQLVNQAHLPESYSILYAKSSLCSGATY